MPEGGELGLTSSPSPPAAPGSKTVSHRSTHTRCWLRAGLPEAGVSPGGLSGPEGGGHFGEHCRAG